MRVLVVEDEDAIASAIERGLTKQGYAVDVAHDGAEALDKANINNYDVICLDLNLPRIDGLEVCRRLREDRFAGGIIMLTARSSIKERIEGLDYGADDYLVKPFDLTELAARLRALARRRNGRRAPVIEVGPLTIDPATRVVRLGDATVDLSAQEYAMLMALVEHPGHVLTRRQLEDSLYALEAGAASNVIEVYVSRLRRKLGRDAIQTVRGIGYRWGTAGSDPDAAETA